MLVYGTIPRPPRRTPADTQLERARALESAMNSVRKEQAKRKIAFALRHPGSPKANEQEEELTKLPSGSPVLVYRQKSKQWEGPFPLVNIDGRAVVVQLPHGRKIFRSTVVKSAIASKPKENWSEGSAKTDEPCQDVVNTMFGSTECVYTIPDDEHTFAESRQKELEGLQARETFDVVDLSEVPSSTRIYGSRWVDTLKKVHGRIIEKSRLVAQNYCDKGATAISTKSPTVSRLGQRLALATAVMFPNHTSYVRDISQAYIQSESKLERLVYLRPPKEMGIGG